MDVIAAFVGNSCISTCNMYMPIFCTVYPWGLMNFLSVTAVIATGIGCIFRDEKISCVAAHISVFDICALFIF